MTIVGIFLKQTAVLLQITRPCYAAFMKLTFETEQEKVGRWLAEVPELSGDLGEHGEPNS
jgi:hypothetical protein